MSIRFNPYAHWEGSGFAGPFADKAAAEKFVEHAKARGRDKARVCAHSSMVQTSDNSPIVVNVTKRDVDTFGAPYGYMCMDPSACAGKGYCPRDPTCGD